MMKQISFSSFFLFIILAFFIEKCNGKASGGGLKRMCDAGTQFLKVYSHNCKFATPTNNGYVAKSLRYGEDSPLRYGQGLIDCHPCAIHDRLEKADEFPSESSQQLQSFRLDAEALAEQKDGICSQGPDHFESLLNRLSKILIYFTSLEKLKSHAPVVALRTLQAQIASVFETLRDYGSRVLTPILLERLNTLETECKTTALFLEVKNQDNWEPSDRETAATFYWKSPEKNSWKGWEILGSMEIHPAPQLYNASLNINDDIHECQLRLRRDCDLSVECANLLMNRSTEASALLHVASFFRLAVRLDCAKEVEFLKRFPNLDWEIIAEGHCSKMWDEVNAIANAEFPPAFSSLFLVHASSCAMLGYPNFLRVDWMKIIMGWMNSTATGCIPSDPKSVNLAHSYDAVAPNGEYCTIYETSLGMQLLAMHLRYLIETCNYGVEGGSEISIPL